MPGLRMILYGMIFLGGMALVGHAQSIGLFNTDTPPQDGSNQVVAGPDNNAALRYQPIVPPAAESAPAIQSAPKVIAEFERLPNESDDAFIARMKAVYKNSEQALQQTTQQVITKLRSLAPPK